MKRRFWFMGLAEVGVVAVIIGASYGKWPWALLAPTGAGLVFVAVCLYLREYTRRSGKTKE